MAMPCCLLFIADYNARFAKAPANNKDLHRPLRAGDHLDDAFAWKEERTLSRALTLEYDKVLFILEPSEQAKAAIGERVTVVDYPDGRLAIRFLGRTRPPYLRQNSPGLAGCDRPKQTARGRARLHPRSSCVANLSVAAGHAGAISRMPGCSRSAEPSYEPSVLAPARSNNRCGFVRPYSGRRSGAALRRGLRAHPPPAPNRTDIFKLGKH
jgi:hypothetical protein